MRKKKKTVVVNNSALLEALVRLRDEELKFCEKNAKLGVGLSPFGLKQHCRIVRDIIDKALTYKPRNCDRYFTALGAIHGWEDYLDNHPELPNSSRTSGAMIPWLFSSVEEGENK